MWGEETGGREGEGERRRGGSKEGSFLTVMQRSFRFGRATKHLFVEILRDDGVGPLRMTSVVPTALVRFFGPSSTMEALLRNKLRSTGW